MRIIADTLIDGEKIDTLITIIDGEIERQLMNRNNYFDDTDDENYCNVNESEENNNNGANKIENHYNSYEATKEANNNNGNTNNNNGIDAIVILEDNNEFVCPTYDAASSSNIDSMLITNCYALFLSLCTSTSTTATCC